LGVDIDPEMNTASLKLLLDKNAMNFQEQIRDISETATKEFNYEKVKDFVTRRNFVQ